MRRSFDRFTTGFNTNIIQSLTTSIKKESFTYTGNCWQASQNLKKLLLFEKEKYKERILFSPLFSLLQKHGNNQSQGLSSALFTYHIRHNILCLFVRMFANYAPTTPLEFLKNWSGNFWKKNIYMPSFSELGLWTN